MVARPALDTAGSTSLSSTKPPSPESTRRPARSSTPRPDSGPAAGPRRLAEPHSRAHPHDPPVRARQHLRTSPNRPVRTWSRRSHTSPSVPSRFRARWPMGTILRHFTQAVAAHHLRESSSTAAQHPPASVKRLEKSGLTPYILIVSTIEPPEEPRGVGPRFWQVLARHRTDLGWSSWSTPGWQFHETLQVMSAHP